MNNKFFTSQKELDDLIKKIEEQGEEYGRVDPVIIERERQERIKANALSWEKQCKGIYTPYPDVGSTNDCNR